MSNFGEAGPFYHFVLCEAPFFYNHFMFYLFEDEVSHGGYIASPIQTFSGFSDVEIDLGVPNVKKIQIKIG